MTEILVDTDVFVDHLRRAAAFDPGDADVAYSVVTTCELFAGRHVDEAVVRRLLSPFAATALVHERTLVTRNLRDYQPIPKLDLRPPR